jgi:S1-C subfamily serine protease
MFKNITLLAITSLMLTSAELVRARAIKDQQTQPKDVIASSTTVLPRRVGGLVIRVVDRSAGRPQFRIVGGGLLMIMNNRYFVLTNLHVVDGFTTFTVELNGTTAEARRIGQVVKFSTAYPDLALLEVSKPLAPAVNPHDFLSDARIQRLGIKEVFNYGPGMGYVGAEQRISFSGSLFRPSPQSDGIYKDATYWRLDLSSWDKATGGVSGSPLLTADGTVIGLMAMKKGKLGIAISMDTITSFLKEFELGLSAMTAPTTRAQVIRSLQRGTGILQTRDSTHTEQRWSVQQYGCHLSQDGAL